MNSKEITTIGRMRCSDPSIQTLTKRTEAGRRIKKAFIGAQHYQLIHCDFQDNEMRMFPYLLKNGCPVNTENKLTQESIK